MKTPFNDLPRVDEETRVALVMAAINAELDLKGVTQEIERLLPRWSWIVRNNEDGPGNMQPHLGSHFANLLPPDSFGPRAPRFPAYGDSPEVALRSCMARAADALTRHENARKREEADRSEFDPGSVDTGYDPGREFYPFVSMTIGPLRVKELPNGSVAFSGPGRS